MRPRMARGVVDANFHGKSELPNGRDQLEHIDDPTNDLQVDYAYDANGNREQRIVRQNNIVTSQVDYTFDARDRLIQAQPNAPNEAIVEYQYDADDRRIARIETPRINGVPQAPITTLYVFDNSTLLHEANLAGITDTYRRSAKLDRHIAHQTNTVRHYQLDALDTPVAMTDATGATVNATTFDAWGNPTQQTAAGTTTVPWQVPNYNPLISGQAALLNNDNQSIGFTGYQKDAAAGLYYAGARFYDPLIGGFSGMDPWAGDNARPITLNKYLYANANPNVYVDPTGLYSTPGHYYTEYYLALRGGFSQKDAQLVAFLSQLPDEVDDMDAIGVQADSLPQSVNNWLLRHTRTDEGFSTTEPLYETSKIEARDSNQKVWHVLDGGIGADETARTLVAMKSVGRDPLAIGLLGHPLGDSYAHCPNRGKCFDTGWGHARPSILGNDPDVIQNRPNDYLEYAQTQVGVFAELNGASPEEIARLKASVRSALQDVAGIARIAGPPIPEWKPEGWMQSPPPAVLRAMGAQRRRSDAELESLSEEALKGKLRRMGANLDYAPETLPGEVGELAKIVPLFLTGRTLQQAVDDFVAKSGPLTSERDVLAAIARVRALVSSLRASERGEPVVVIESTSGDHMQEPASGD